MRLEDLKSGAYQLEAPVKNPYPDRRSTIWKRRAELPAGRYHVTVFDAEKAWDALNNEKK